LGDAFGEVMARIADVTTRLQAEIGFPEGIRGSLGVAPPDCGFDVVLEQDGGPEPRDIRRNEQKIAHQVIEPPHC